MRALPALSVPGFRSATSPLLGCAALLLLGACAGRGSGPAMTPVPQPPITVTPAPAPAPAPAPEPTAADTARGDWHRLDLTTDGVPGVGSERALRELLANRQPRRQVVVAVLDGGIDTAHTLLSRQLWRNSRETPGNGRDDDRNGRIDDVLGWNFTATGSGDPVHHDTFEVTRLHAACRGQPAGRDTPRPSASTCDSLATAYRAKSQEVNGTLRQILGIEGAFTNASTALATALGAKPTPATVSAFSATTPALEQAKRLYLQLAANGLDEDALKEAKAAYSGQARYGLDTLYQPRGAADTTGSRDVMGPDALHGTHVAGIIGAARGAGNAVQGIAPSVQLMAVRVVPDGDERDDDVARAIRYAVDQGAQIINMSFGKAYSPRKAAVDSAVRYAVAKGVLLVHAAGNDAEDNDVTPSYPSSVLLDGARAATWMEVGASTRHADQRLPAGFSNYGQTRVDLFAPGDAILSTAPGGGFKRESGTSMAAPVVSGVAALLMAYFPELTATQVKALLLETARRFPGLEVETPGSGEKVAFAKLSASGGVIDAYAAVKAAMEREIRK